MSKGWADNEAWGRILAKAESHSGLPLRGWMSDGPEAAVKEQAHAPTIIVSHSVGIFEAHAHSGMPLPNVAAGHSLGMYSALAASGAVPLEAALDLVLGVESLAADMFGRKGFGMAYLTGIKENDLIRSLRTWPELCIANINTHAQFTVSGPRETLENLLARFGKDCTHHGLLPLKYPLHSPHMLPLLPRLKKLLASVAPGNMAFPLISHVDGRVMRDGAEAWGEALESIALPVAWPRVVNRLRNTDCEIFECGHGKHLSKMCRWIEREMSVGSLECPSGLSIWKQNAD